MTTQLATALVLGIIGWLFWHDFRERSRVTNALWLPFLWAFISGTRFPTEWMQMFFGTVVGGTSTDEGSPVDAVFFFVIILLGLAVLAQRRVNLSVFIRHNPWVVLYLLYCLLSVLWSDIPLVAFKRWIKLFGQPVMVLVLLTEPDPLEAFTRLLKRLAYVILPVSILFTRYYPEWGRAWDGWTGAPMNTGITTNKNSLGCDAFMIGLFFLWHLLRVWRREPGPKRTFEIRLSAVFLLLTVWALHTARSSTSTGVLVLGTAVMLLATSSFIRRRIVPYFVGGLVFLVIAELVFGIHNLAIAALGRETTLTGRTDVWKVLITWDINPLLGVGYESFWRDSIMAKMAILMPGLVINESHNGYLETYLSLGLIGLFLLLAMFVAAFRKATRALNANLEIGSFPLGYVMAFAIYNVTEAAFRTHGVPFFIFFLMVIEYPWTPAPMAETKPALENAEYEF